MRKERGRRAHRSDEVRLQHPRPVVARDLVYLALEQHARGVHDHIHPPHRFERVAGQRTDRGIAPHVGRERDRRLGRSEPEHLLDRPVHARSVEVGADDVRALVGQRFGTRSTQPAAPSDDDSHSLRKSAVGARTGFGIDGHRPHSIHPRPKSTPLRSFESKGSVVVVDRHKRHGLVTRHRRDLSQHVTLRPPWSGRQVGDPVRPAPFRVGNPEQSVRLDGSNGVGPEAPKLIGAVHEELDDVVRLSLKQPGGDVGGARGVSLASLETSPILLYKLQQMGHLDSQRSLPVFGGDKTGFSSMAKKLRLAAQASDVIQLFVNSADELRRLGSDAIRAVKPDGLLWITYPKGGVTHGVTNLPATPWWTKRDVLGEITSVTGYKPVAFVAIDDNYRALRFKRA